MASQPSGFFNAPVIKGIFVLSVASTVMTKLVNNGDFLQLDSEGLSNYRLWKLVTCHWGFNSPGEMLIGNYMLYSFREFERQMGSSKFIGFVILAGLVSSLLQAGLLSTFGLGKLSSGPFYTVYSLLYMYFVSIPKMKPDYIQLFGITISSKSFFYLLAAQVALNRGLESFIPSIAGLIFGWLYYHQSMINLQGFHCPEFISNAAEAILLPLFGSSRPLTAQERQLQNEMRRRLLQQQMQAIASGNTSNVEVRNSPGSRMAASVMPTAPTTPPSEEDISQLTSMGFEREQAIGALGRSDNNVAIAANHLVSGM